MRTQPSTRRRRAVGLALGAMATALLLPTAAEADYAPSIVIGGAVYWEGMDPYVAVPGDSIAFANDTMTGCADEGVALAEATWTFGTPGDDHGLEVGDEILTGTAVPDAEGAWSASFTVPADLAPGRYLLAGTCGPKAEPFLTYHGAFIEVLPVATTSVVATTTTVGGPPSEETTTTAPAPTATGARPVRANATYTG